MRKGCDICRLLERHMKLWHNGQFDALLQEAVRCDQSLRNSRRRPSFKDFQEHLIKVFTRLMLEGNVHAAVRWLTERSGGGVLKPSDFTNIGGISMTVLEALNLKHPDPCTPLFGFYQGSTRIQVTYLWISYLFWRIQKSLDLTF